MSERAGVAGPVTSGRALARSVAGLELLEIDVEPALAALGLTPQQAAKLEDPIPLVWLRDFWDAVVTSTGQSGLGLRIAEQIRPEAYEVFGSLVAASGTLGEALLRATRLIGLVTRTVRLSFHHEGDHVTLAVEPFYAKLVHRETTEFMVGAIHFIALRLVGRPLTGGEVCFMHAPPRDLSHHRRLFTDAVRFRAPFSGVIFDAKLLDVPIQSRNSELCLALQRQADELVGRKQTSGFETQVRAALAVQLDGGDASAERVAAALALHRKTLTRRLKAEGTSFRRLRDELRMQLARRYLGQPGLSVEEVALRLGYSERSAFYRAFRRWTGHAPRARDPLRSVRAESC